MPPPKGSYNPIEAPGDYDCTETVHNDTYPAIDSSKADLSGKAVMVVGGSKGIGKGMAKSFARAGASDIVITARSFPDVLEKEVLDAAAAAGKSAPKIHLVKMEISSLESVEAARVAVEKDVGRLDILVNNAGILPQMAKLADGDPEAWWRTYEINVKGPYYTCRTFIPLLLKNPEGLKTIINVASVGGIVVSPTLSDYQGSKAAVIRMSEFIAKEYADAGIICIPIHPGNIVTDIIGPDGPPKEIAHVFTETVELAGDTVVWLSGGSGERKQWLNGRYVTVCWDMPELESMKDKIVQKDLLKPKLVYPQGPNAIGF